MLDRKLFSLAPNVRKQSSPVFPLPNLNGQPPVLLVFNQSDLSIDIAYERNHVPGGPFVRPSTADTRAYWIPRLTAVFAVSDGAVIALVQGRTNRRR